MKLVALLALTPALVVAQGWPTSDVITHLGIWKDVAKATEAIEVAKDVRHNTLSTDLWLGQIFLSKLPWATSLPKTPQNTQVMNTIGELAGWGPALSGGYGGRNAWSTARTRLENMAAIMAAKQPKSSTTPGTPPIIGGNLMSQLATVEAIDGAGANNLDTIGQARAFLEKNLPAIEGLQEQILSPDKESNGPTQQMQLASSAAAQHSAIAVQNLQVQTGMLETITALVKHFADADTADLNLQAARAQIVATEPTGPTGWAEAYKAHK